MGFAIPKEWGDIERNLTIQKNKSNDGKYVSIRFIASDEFYDIHYDAYAHSNDHTATWTLRIKEQDEKAPNIPVEYLLHTIVWERSWGITPREITVIYPDGRKEVYK